MDGHSVKVSFKPLKSNLINLPSNLSSLLFNANIKIQDVIVEIVVSSKAKYYAGWSGMSSEKIKTIEIDPIFAESLHILNDENVTLYMKVNNYETTSISLEPETSSDWELVEIHAQTIEDKLISQTRCVSLNQTLVVYPSQTTSAKLIVTSLGGENHQYAKISPYAEISIAPKVKVKKPNSVSDKSTKSSKSTSEERSGKNVLLRGIPLPHDIFKNTTSDENTNSYEVYINSEIRDLFSDYEYLCVSIVPGPNSGQSKNPIQDDQQNEKDKIGNSLKESTKIIARAIYYDGCPKDTVGISKNLAISLNTELLIGSVVILQPPTTKVSKRPAVFVVHPYITQSKKASQLNLSERKSQANKLTEELTKYFYLNENSFASSPLTNYTKLPIIPKVLPLGGLLEFKKNDSPNAWIKPHDGKKQSRIELGEDLLRPNSFIENRKAEVNRGASDVEIESSIGIKDLIIDIVDSVTISSNTGTLVYGNSGSGKTLILSSVAKILEAEFGYHTKYISCETIMNENLTSLMNNHFGKWIQECAWYKPSLLILDNLDKILNAENENVNADTSNQLSGFLISQLNKIQAQNNSNLSILVSSTSKETLNKILSQYHLFENIYSLKAPDKSTRNKFITGYLDKKGISQIKFDIMDLVLETEGYMPNDLKVLCDRLYNEVLFTQVEKGGEGDLIAHKQHLDLALKDYTPSSLLGVKLQKSTVNWEDIGGLKQAKDILLETLEWPTKYAPIFANCPLRLRSGILLYGYPGCGKTFLASAVASQCGLNFISIKGPEILNKYIGASEQSVRELFERAQAAKPCILFFDEFDSIAPKRGHDSTGVTDRVVNQMLTQMDGAEGLDGVYVLAATSRPDLIDSALLRPGRLDKSVICDMPNLEDRLDILESITRNMDLGTDVDLSSIAQKTAGYSGADMQGLAYNAYLKAVHSKLAKDEEIAANENENEKEQASYEFFQIYSEKIKSNKIKPSERINLLKKIEELFQDNTNEEKSKSSSSNVTIAITHKDFLDSLADTKPSISVSEKLKLETVYKEFVSDRDGNMPDGTASTEVGGRTSLM